MRSEKRRLAMLISAVRPAKSLAARLANLTPEQHSAYQTWRDQRDQWHRNHPDANAYERVLGGDAGPQLRKNVSDALFGATPVITVEMTEADAVEAYRRFAFGD